MSDLVVGGAQSISTRGDIDANVAEHLGLIDHAASFGVRLIVFPELSLTGYEPEVASTHQLKADDRRLEPLRRAATKHGMHVLAGGPWASGLDRPYLGAFLLSSGPSVSYAKIHVHHTEEEYFAPGREDCVVSIGGVPTGIAICADASHSSHPARAAGRGAELYVACVMKTDEEYPAYAGKLGDYAARHGMAVLMANHAGTTGGSASAGKSAIWDDRGKLLAVAGPAGRALVIGRRENGCWSGEIVEGP